MELVLNNVFFLQKEESEEPSQVTRLKVWVKSHTKKDGTPVNTNAAEKFVRYVIFRTEFF